MSEKEDNHSAKSRASQGSSINRGHSRKLEADEDHDQREPPLTRPLEDEGRGSVEGNGRGDDGKRWSLKSDGSIRKEKRRRSSKAKATDNEETMEDVVVEGKKTFSDTPVNRKSLEISDNHQQKIRSDDNAVKKEIGGRKTQVKQLSSPPHPTDGQNINEASGFNSQAEKVDSIFRVSNPSIAGHPVKYLNEKEEKQPRFRLSGDSGKKQQQYQQPPPTTPQPPPTTSSVEEEFYEFESAEPEEETTTFEDGESGYSYVEYESKEDTLNEEDVEMIIQQQKSRRTLLREEWEKISSAITRTFNSPSRVYKLRGYHSEPDLTLPFEDKFDPKIEDDRRHLRTDGMIGADGYISVSDSIGGFDEFKKVKEKFVSCEDIAQQISGKEYPDLVRGALSEVKLRSYAIDDNMKNSWWELYDWERKRFSFFDELFAMGYVVDSLEVLSPPPKDSEGKPLTTGEYFVEADERHYRKKVDYGRVVFKTKHVYTGNFQDWYFEGPGRYCWQDGTVYQGEFSNGLMHGPGSIHWPDGCIYEGRFIYGKRTGWGVYTSADGQNTYAGEWLNGLPHGHGKMWYDPEDDDNDYYEGQWEGGLPKGMGTRQYSTGDRYVGNWMDGMRNGYGIIIWLQERQVYKGEWLNGVPHGFGKHIWYLERSPSNSFPTRHVYQGNWVMGKREGIGKMMYPCGSIYEGRWKNGQRHGKGLFINPAGDILVGLFRAGSILGGSDVPLHAPTYDCDYVGLTEWLTAKFKLTLREDNAEEKKLLELTIQYLPYLRKLYHRAGEYSQKYGKHGLYPSYMKKSYLGSTSKQEHYQGNQPTYYNETSNRAHPRNHNRFDDPEHMKGKVEKPESLDGVNPVTRFGLWLLLRDCENVLDEVTTAYYDKIWCETPPLSFQTRHNPFEPVYLWQFLQALIVTSVSYFNDIPRLRQHTAEKVQTAMEPAAVSDTTLKNGMSSAEQRRSMIARRMREVQLGQNSKLYSPVSYDQQTVVGKGKKHRGKSINPGAIGALLKEDGKAEKRHKKQAVNKDQPNDGGGVEIPNKGVIEKDAVWESGSSKGKKEPEGGKRKSGESSNKSKGSAGKRKSRVSGEGLQGNEKAHDDTTVAEDELSTGEENEDLEDLGEEGDEEMIEGNDRKSVLFHGEDENDLESAKFSISDCFERFLVKKLLPCLRREPGENLPVMPQPLPALVDMYDAFKGIKQRDIVRGKEFLRSALPHLLFPSRKDALWWHRCPEPLSVNVNIDELLEMYRGKFENVESDAAMEENFEDKLESEYLGAQAQNSETTLRLLRLCKDDPLAPECHFEGVGLGQQAPIVPLVDSADALADLKGKEDVDDFTPLADFTTEGYPFAEDELVPEPFLWADDYKCIPVRRKYQHFENINTQDVLNVIRKLYPKLCTGKHENDLQFELIFCDWLWCISLLAKTSTERECRDAWKDKSNTRPFTNPQSLGVYAHYVKQIKNNPYLSPNPPPDFQPKRKRRQFGPSPTPEKKEVKFL